MYLRRCESALIYVTCLLADVTFSFDFVTKAFNKSLFALEFGYIL